MTRRIFRSTLARGSGKPSRGGKDRDRGGKGGGGGFIGGGGSGGGGGGSTSPRPHPFLLADTFDVLALQGTDAPHPFTLAA